MEYGRREREKRGDNAAEATFLSLKIALTGRALDRAEPFIVIFDNPTVLLNKKAARKRLFYLTGSPKGIRTPVARMRI